MRASEAIRRFQDAAKIAFLATVDGQWPRVRPMSPVTVEGNVIYMAAHAGSAKMRQMTQNPNVEVCYMDPDHRHLRLRGRFAMVNDQEIKRRMWQDYPLMQRYWKTADDPQYALFCVTVTEAYLMESMSLDYARLEV